MGCDIHLHAERLVEYENKALDGTVQSTDSYWTPVKWPVRTCWWCEGTGKARIHQWEREPGPRQLTAERLAEREAMRCGYCNPEEPPSNYDEYDLKRWVGKAGFTREPWYDNRNYTVFAVLADVRNEQPPYYIEPIAETRDLPDDASSEVRSDYEGWGADAHSASWLTLDEVFAYNWALTFRDHGWVNLANFREWKENGKPSSWSGMVAGGAIQHLDNAEMEKKLAEALEKGADLSTAHPLGMVTDPEWNKYYTEVSWESTREEYVRPFLMKMRDLERYCLEKYQTGPDKVRVVFWFDN